MCTSTLGCLTGFLAFLLLCPPAVASSQPQGTAPAATVEQSPLRKDVAEALWWLPANTEVVIVDQQKQKLSYYNAKAAEKAAEREDDTPLPADWMQTMSFGGLTGLKEGKLYNLLKGQTLTFSISGSRKFRPPTSLGSMLHEGAEIAVFETDLGETGASFMAAAVRTAWRTEEIEGRRVAIFQEKLEQDLLRLYLVRPRGNVLILATDREYLREVLRRMDQGAATRALPDNLPEWKLLDGSAPFWVIRHYDRAGANSDPSSPFGGKKAANTPDEEAVGLVFASQAQPGPTLKILYLSNNKNAVQIAKDAWSDPSEGLTAEARQAQPGVIEITAHVPNTQAASTFLFYLMGALGQAIYL